ncbi:MAG: hypothetical protein ACOY5F_20870 [Pseudomonadota bacterium]
MSVDLRLYALVNSDRSGGHEVQPEGFAALAACARSRAPTMPVGAIAGIDEGNAADVIAVATDGIAVMSALSLATDPAKGAERLRGIVDDGLHLRGAA